MLFYVIIGSMILLAYYAIINYQRQEIPQDSTKIKMLKEKISRLEKTLQKQSLTTTTSNSTEVTTKTSEMKYILQWTSGGSFAFVYMGEGQSKFFEKNCKYTNCYVTSDKSYLPDIRMFDVIAFSGPEIVSYGKDWLPKKRSSHQKYAFASMESSDNYPVCNDLFNGFFNWTWTFKTSSDSRWGYLIIRDANKKVIGPNTIMHWIKSEDMDPVSEELKQNLRKKTKAAAWFVSNCNSRSGRKHYVRQLQEELRKYKLNVDIFGTCGTLQCSRDKHDDECVKLIDRDYYFYLSFENSFSEDYVTEKLLHAVQHNAVPIVYGAANYTRFMPDGIYLNARKLGVQKLAKKMYELINDPEEYSQYFRWQNHYSYHYRDIVPETNDYCHFCEMLNDEKLVKKTTIYENFREWWTPPNRC